MYSANSFPCISQLTCQIGRKVLLKEDLLLLNSVILTHNMWARALDEGHQVDVVFFDFSKGFDRVPHQTLLHKLSNFGISGILLNWCQYYLSTRRQRVVINGYSFSLTEITSGVPQGSILGPLEVNINNYPSCSQTCSYAQQFLDCLQSYALNSLPSNKPLGLYSLPVRILIGACQILSKPLLEGLNRGSL